MMDVCFYKYAGQLTIVPTICLIRRARNFKFSIAVVWLNFGINFNFRRSGGEQND